MLSLSQIKEALRIHRNTAKKAMTELVAVELVDEVKPEGGSDHHIGLSLRMSSTGSLALNLRQFRQAATKIQRVFRKFGKRSNLKGGR